MVDSDINLSAVSQGPQFTTIGTQRLVRTYAVTEPELDTLSTLSTVAALCFSLGGAFAGFALDSYRDWAIHGTEGAFPFAAASALPAAVFFIVGGYLAWKRWSVTRNLKVPQT